MYVVIDLITKARIISFHNLHSVALVLLTSGVCFSILRTLVVLTDYDSLTILYDHCSYCCVD